MKHYEKMKMRNANLILGGEIIELSKQGTDEEENVFIDVYKVKKYYVFQLFKFVKGKDDIGVIFNEVNLGFFKVRATSRPAVLKNELETLIFDKANKKYISLAHWKDKIVHSIIKAFPQNYVRR